MENGEALEQARVCSRSRESLVLEPARDSLVLEQDRKNLEDSYTLRLTGRMEAYREDCATLRHKLEDKERCVAETQERSLEREEHIAQEVAEAMSAAAQAAQRQLDAVHKDALALWGRFEAEENQCQVAESRLAAVERDAREKISSFKKDCVLLESKVEAIEKAAQTQVKTFSDDCYALQGRLEVEQGLREHGDSKIHALRALERTAEQRIAVYREECKVLSMSVESFEQAAEHQLNSLTQDCHMLQGSLHSEQSQCEDQRIKTEGLREACRQQREVFHAEYRQQRDVFHAEYGQQRDILHEECMRAQDQLRVEQGRHSSLEQLLTATDQKGKEAVGGALEQHEAFHKEYMRVEEQLWAEQMKHSSFEQRAEGLLHAEQIKHSSLEQALMATECDAQAKLQEAERSGITQQDFLRKHLAVIEKQKAGIDADASGLRKRLAASEVLVDALSAELGPPPELVLEVAASKRESAELMQQLASERLRGDGAQAESSSLSAQLRLQEFQSEEAQALAAKLAEQLEDTEVRVGEVVQRTVDTCAAQLSDASAAAVEALQLRDASAAEVETLRQQQSLAEGTVEQAAASAVEALQLQVQQAVAATSEARGEVLAEMQRCQELQLESTVASGGARSPLFASPFERLTTPAVNSLQNRRALDIELQKQVILGALQKRGGSLHYS